VLLLLTLCIRNTLFEAKELKSEVGFTGSSDPTHSTLTRSACQTSEYNQAYKTYKTTLWTLLYPLCQR